MSPRDVFILCVALAACMAVAGRRGGWFSARPKRIRHDDLEKQIAADFPPIDWPEARALVESVLAHARPDDRAMVWRKLLDAVRGDMARLRRAVPNTIASLEKIYRLLGDVGGDASAAPPA